MCYADVFMILLLVGGVLCFVAFGIDTSDLTNLYLGVVLVLVVVISATFGECSVQEPSVRRTLLLVAAMSVCCNPH